MNRFLISLVSLLIIIFAIFSFVTYKNQKKETPQQLFTERASGVVVVLNEYYYEMKLPNGNRVYFSDYDEEGFPENYTIDIEKVKKSIITGTGFFVDTRGTIMTNRHVAQPHFDAAKIKNSYVSFVRTCRELCSNLLVILQSEYQNIEDEKSDYIYYDEDSGTYYYDREKVQELKEKQNEIQESIDEMEENIDNLNTLSDPDEIRIQVRNRIGIAFNNTYVTSVNDFFGSNECVPIKISEEENVDLALIQLKRQNTPKESYIFNINNNQKKEVSIIELLCKKVEELFSTEVDDEWLRVGQPLYMIGYNAGLALGTTKQGVKVQMNRGNLTQMPDGQRLLYNIPAIQGSSGSPVIDEKGRLVGVNFATYGTSGSFNFGIPIEVVRKFYTPNY